MKEDLKTTIASLLKVGAILSAAFGFKYLTGEQQTAIIQSAAILFSVFEIVGGYFTKDK